MKLLLVFFILFQFNQVLGQYNSGVVEYGTDFNEQALKKLENVKNDKYPNQLVQKFKNIALAHKKFYSANRSFLKLTFNKNAYLLEPIDIMLPEYLKGKFIHKSSTYYHNLNTGAFLKKFKKRNKTYITSFSNEYNWEIKNQFKNILGFKCRKAILQLPKKKKINSSPGFHHKVR